MRLDLKEFAQATRSMHQQPGGVKRTRLMLRLRPHQSRKIFIMKATDGRITVTTRVESQGDLKLVEGIVDEFVAECTKASAGNSALATAAASAGDQRAGNAATASPASASAVHPENTHGAAATAAKVPGQAGTSGASDARHGQQTQSCTTSKASHNSSGAGKHRKSKKGGRH